MELYTISTLILTLAVLLSYINHRFIKISTTTAIATSAFLLSFVLIIIGELGFREIESKIADTLIKIPFDTIVINGILGLLLFAGGLRIDISHLKRQKWEITVLSVLGTFANTLLAGFAIYYLLPLFGINIALKYCMLFGALISPTDPIAVLAIFKEQKIPSSLRIIVEGESLFNDGIGIVIFFTLHQLIFSDRIITFSNVTTLFLQNALGGIVYGITIGLLTVWLIKPIDEHKIEVLITLLVATAGYVLAQAMHISGPLAMVVAGIIIGNKGRMFSMSATTIKYLDDFWELIEEILNTVLFLLIGLELLAFDINKGHIMAAIFAVVILLAIRTLIVSVPMQIFKHYKKYPPATIKILIWGGLRGALPFALALSLPTNEYRNLILTMTYAVVAFSIIVQGMTIHRLVKLSNGSLI